MDAFGRRLNGSKLMLKDKQKMGVRVGQGNYIED
jgi:hypothetical protein